MSTVKETLKNILVKAEQGLVTIEEIREAQSLLESSVIISPRRILYSGTVHRQVRNQPFEYRVQPEFVWDREEYYTVQEVAERYKVSDKAVYKWVEQNKIEYTRSKENSRDIRIPKSQFKTPPSKDYIDQREHKLFKNATELELVRRNDLYHDEDKE